jgi:hypothetical protein
VKAGVSEVISIVHVQLLMLVHPAVVALVVRFLFFFFLSLSLSAGAGPPLPGLQLGTRPLLGLLRNLRRLRPLRLRHPPARQPGSGYACPRSVVNAHAARHTAAVHTQIESPRGEWR